MEKLLIKQQKLNKKLAIFFKKHSIKNFRLISLGNSIASGYSMTRTIKPLLLRNESLETIMKDNGIHLERHNFARAQNNNDEHFFEYLVTNMKESEINILNRVDYSGGPTGMPNNGISQKEIDRYYPTEIEQDLGLQDLILEKNINIANVIIYNGCTGSLLDNWLRSGTLIEKLTYGINRDARSLEAILKFIQSHNRKNNTNTQVYLCGVPNFLGVRISEIINAKLKRIAKQYANVVYVEPIISKLIYKPILSSANINCNDPQFESKRYTLPFDIHYDEEEYLKLNNNIMEAINNNYAITNSMIEIDRNLYNFSSELEIKYQNLQRNNLFIQRIMEEFIKEETYMIKDPNDKKRLYSRLKSYLINRAPYDFHYIKKRNIRRILTK